MMTLRPINDIEGESVDYNAAGWDTLCGMLLKWGVLTEEFKGVNDGDIISADTCREVARAIAKHLGELDEDDQHWLWNHSMLWHYLADHGGCEQR